MDTIRKSEYLGPAAAGLSLGLIVRLAYLRLLPKPLSNVPHNPVTSVWGDIPEMGQFMEGGKKNIVDYFASMIAKHGPISQIVIARTNIVVIADKAEYERLLLRTKSLEQSRLTNAVFGTVIPTSQISLPTNEMWKRHRQLTGPSMSRRYLEHMSARVSTGANNLVRLWTRKVELTGDKAFDAYNDMRIAVMDTILSIAVGDSPSFVDVVYASLAAHHSSPTTDKGSSQFPQSKLPPLQQSLRTMMEILENIQHSPFPITIARVLTWMVPSRRKSYNMISDFLAQKITEARARENELVKSKQGDGLATDADCVVDMIAQRETREGAEAFNDGELLDELVTYVLAGQDTTSAALSWLFKYLPLDTDIQQRLHDEVCAVLGPGSDEGRYLDFNALNDSQRVPVLEAVVTETLRCGMPAPIVGRELLNDEVVLGRHLPTGTQIMFPIAYMSMLESDWGPDAKIWRPSRWLREDGSFNSSAGPSYPFGIGQRSCFGQRLAVLQMKAFVAVLSRAFVSKQLPSGLDNWDTVQKTTREPKSFSVSLERWSTD